MGATLAWGETRPWRSRERYTERRDLFAQGVASGDPHPDSVLLWTRASAAGDAGVVSLTVEVAEDEGFERVVVAERARALAEADHTCRVLVGGLQPARTYWYRFVTADGLGSRIGRTRTAPAPDDPHTVRFTFVSCQNVCEGAQNAYRRMIFEDERAAAGDELAFVLHLGDFVYEVVDYPEDAPGGHRYDRRLRDVVRYPDGEKVQGFHVAASLRDYRTLYRAYLQDPDLQDARARWPFVAIWDNHEFSWLGWQSFQRFGSEVREAQTRRVAASQAWFEYQPARVRKAGGDSVERFEAPVVRDAKIERFDDFGLGQEENNLRAIGSLSPYRSLRFGRHLELFVTEHYTHRSQEPTSRREADGLSIPEFPELYPEEALRVLDAGRAALGGRPPQTIAFGSLELPNFRRDEPTQTMLGPAQKAWFLERLRASTATWKVWGNSLGTLDWRVDPQKLPAGMTKPWPGAGYACFGGGGDWSTCYCERAEIYDAVRSAGITGFVTVSGDRHSFWAGLSAKALPPLAFEPVGVAFITGSVSAPGIVEAYEHRFPKEPSAARALRGGRRGRDATGHQPAAAPRRPDVPRVQAHGRPEAGPGRFEPRAGSASLFPRHGRPRLRGASRRRRRRPLRLRLPPAAARAQRDGGRRPAPLSHFAPRAALAEGRDAAARTHGERGRSRAFGLNLRANPFATLPGERFG
jgi:alkaline phosphatase D